MNHETRYILTGGNIQSAEDGGKAYCEEVVRDHGNSVNAVSILFARDQELWNGVIERDNVLFGDMVPHVEFHNEIGNPENLRSQIDRADIVLIHGGSTSRLLEKLNEDYLKGQDLSGKTIVGHSAGTYLLSKYYIEVTEEGQIQLSEGQNHIDIKSVVHYGSDFYPDKFPNAFSWDKVDELLDSAHPETPAVRLAEGEFVLFQETSDNQLKE
jgi:peptidase E